MTGADGQDHIEELRSWVHAAPVTFWGNYDRWVVGDVLQFSLGADEAAGESLSSQARAITHQDQVARGEPIGRDHDRFF